MHTLSFNSSYSSEEPDTNQKLKTLLNYQKLGNRTRLTFNQIQSRILLVFIINDTALSGLLTCSHITSCIPRKLLIFLKVNSQNLCQQTGSC